MAYTFAEAQRLLETIKYIEPDSIFVEIGSDRGEESTQYLAGLENVAPG
jgi:UDP-N-acetyl-D-mannosaminuronic acid transferase (WecB/TagA/CpsF family)